MDWRFAPQQPQVVFFEHTALGQLHGGIKLRIPAQRRQQAVRPILSDDPFYNLRVIGSIYVRTASSGSVMIVAGLLLTSTTLSVPKWALMGTVGKG